MATVMQSQTAQELAVAPDDRVDAAHGPDGPREQDPASGPAVEPRGDPRIRSTRPDEARVSIEVVTTFGRAEPVAFHVRTDVVEIWLRDRCCGVLNRKVLRTWLAEPGAPLVTEGAALSVDRMVDTLGRVAISLPDVLVWTLAPTALAELTKRV